MSSSEPNISESPISEAKLAANRLNALKSTGPKSDEGKAIVGQNNLRHGLTGSFAVLAWESAEDYEALRQALQNEHQPATPTEELLVERLAQHHWLAQRAPHPAKPLLGIRNTRTPPGALSPLSDQ